MRLCRRWAGEKQARLRGPELWHTECTLRSDALGDQERSALRRRARIPRDLSLDEKEQVGHVTQRS
jgi:hypothetical protein